MPKTKVSIITINLNNKFGLEKTIMSVSGQAFKSFEYIVIDGNSQDGSVDIIETYSKHIDYWVSEPDVGVYSAMNKGIAKARGEYLLFLNSGDTLVNAEVLKKVSLHLDGIDLVYGDFFLVDEFEKQRKVIFPTQLDFQYFKGLTLPHPATFIKNGLFDKVGRYSENFKIVSDWEFFIKAVCIHNCSYTKVNIPISIFRTDGISYNIDNTLLIEREKNQVFQKSFPDFNSGVEKAQKERKSSMVRFLLINEFFTAYVIMLNKFKRLFLKIKSLVCF